MDSDDAMTATEERYLDAASFVLHGGMPTAEEVNEISDQIVAILHGKMRTHILVALASVLAGWLRGSPTPIAGVRMVAALAIKGLLLDKATPPDEKGFS